MLDRCASETLGIEDLTIAPGPVAVYLDSYFNAGRGGFSDVLTAGVVLSRDGVVDAEAAFAAYIEGLTADEKSAGYDLVGGNGELDGLFVTRTTVDSIVVHFPPTLPNIDSLSTSFTGGLFYELILGTAFSDPTVELVTLRVEAEASDLCGYLKYEPGCSPVTRNKFFGQNP